MTLQETQKDKMAAYELQEVTIEIGVEWIMERTEEKYVEELRE